MKIYFAFSIRGAKVSRRSLEFLADVMKRYGEILTEVGQNELLVDAAKRGLTDEEVYARDISWLENADVLVAEVTAPSLGVGYEIAKAEALGKPVLCLYKQNIGRKLSAMIAGNPKLTLVKYKSANEAKRYLQRFLSALSNEKQ